MIVDIGKQLKFTKSSYKEINGLFLEELQNSRYHLHLYSRDENFGTLLNTIAKPSSEKDFKTIEICKNNYLFIIPPFNNSVYNVRPLVRNDVLFEKVIQFPTGPGRTILDILLLIDVVKYPIHYIVCNRDDTFIAFKEGTDALLVMELLKSSNIHANLSSSYATVNYVEAGENQVPEMVVETPVLQVTANNNFRTVRSAVRPINQRQFRRNASFSQRRHQNNNSNVRNNNRGRMQGNGRNWQNQHNNHRSQVQQNRQALQNHRFQQNRRYQRASQQNSMRNVRINVPNQVNPNDYNIIFVPK